MKRGRKGRKHKNNDLNYYKQSENKNKLYYIQLT